LQSARQELSTPEHFQIDSRYVVLGEVGVQVSKIKLVERIRVNDFQWDTTHLMTKARMSSSCEQQTNAFREQSRMLGTINFVFKERKLR